ncbi:MAG: hypothetical protein V1858_02790 [Candidatus Gottesmanbacteria bacterium]
MNNSKQERQPISLNEYNPLDWPDVYLLVGEDIPVPKHKDLKPNQISVWETVMLKSGTIICNFIHRSFPNTYCQIQLSPDKIGQHHVFMQHFGPREAHITEELVDQIFLDNIAPQIKDELEKNKE